MNTHGTGAYDDAALSQALQAVADFRPRAIRERLGLNKPIYARTAAYGHFGRTPEADGGFTWEKLDLVDALKNELSSGKYNDAERSDNVRIADFSSK